MRARTALAELLKAEPDWCDLFRSCCETSAFRLRAQTYWFCDELRERGQDLQKAAVEDALMGLARELLPESPAAEWDEGWADELMADAIARLGEHCAGLSAGERDALDLSPVWERNDEIVAAGVANDPAAFRAALKGWKKAALRALEEARAGGETGAA